MVFQFSPFIPRLIMIIYSIDIYTALPVFFHPYYEAELNSGIIIPSIRTKLMPLWYKSLSLYCIIMFDSEDRSMIHFLDLFYAVHTIE